MVLASVTSKVSLAKQAMQQLTAELAELTGPGQSPQGRGGLSPSPTSSSLEPSAFAAPAAQQAALGGITDSRSSSRQSGMALNVLGQPVKQHHQQHPQQPLSQQNSAWHDYKNLWQQQRSQQQQQQPPYQQQYQQGYRHGAGPAPMGDPDSWSMPAGHDAPMPVYQQQPYERRPLRFSTGSLSPSGVLLSDMRSPSMSPHAADGMPVAWPRLRGVFNTGVLSTEELVALYADSGAASEKKLVYLLEEALAAAHAEKVSSCTRKGRLWLCMAACTMLPGACPAGCNSAHCCEWSGDCLTPCGIAACPGCLLVQRLQTCCMLIMGSPHHR